MNAEVSKECRMKTYLGMLLEKVLSFKKNKINMTASSRAVFKSRGLWRFEAGDGRNRIISPDSKQRPREQNPNRVQNARVKKK